MWSVFAIISLSALLSTHAQDSRSSISRELADSTNSFSLDLFKEELKEKSGNVVISPVSVSTLLAILQQGAGGKTLDQLTEGLRATPEESRQGYSLLTRNLKTKEGNETLEFANGAFLQNGYPVREKIQDIIENDFQSSIENVHFSQAPAAAARINSWVAEHTHERIKNLISSDALSSDTRFVLTNAIYFKALWKSQFKTENTRAQEFYTEGDSAGTPVQMMHMNSKFVAGTLEHLDAKWVFLPFQGGRFSMLLVVPKEVNGVTILVEKMKNQDLSKLVESASKTALQNVILTVPKFKMSSTMPLIEPLSRLGMTDIFSGSANLSGISEEHVYVSDVIQKAEIEVDEQGATASAATGVFTTVLSAVLRPPPPLVITADHPFLAFIVDTSNNVLLFACRINKPAASS